MELVPNPEFNYILNEEQIEAVKVVQQSISQNRDCVIHGLAGTGKSVTLTYLAHMLSAHVAAPTGKAALVVTNRLGRQATTIHGLFYKFIGDDIDTKTKKSKPVFVFEPRVGKGDIVLIDECSMVTEKTKSQIKDTGARVIAFGDPGQLPPVNEPGGFLKADYVIQTIQRQAAESPIIQQAYRVREGKRYHDSGIEGFRVNSDISDDDLINADIVLCWKNKTVADFNEAIRILKGFSGRYPQKGEPVLCLRNWASFGIMNGGIYECTVPYSPDKKTIGIFVNNQSIIIPCCEWKTTEFKDPIKTSFDFGYALTGHKSQGSEWEKVLLIDEFRGQDRNRWLYTTFTRASKHLSVFPMFS